MAGSGLDLLTGTRKFWFPHVQVVLSLNKMFCEDRAKKRRGQEMGEEMRGRTNWSIFQDTVFSRTGLQLSGTAPALGAGSQRKTMFWPFVQWRPYLHTEGFSTTYCWPDVNIWVKNPRELKFSWPRGSSRIRLKLYQTCRYTLPRESFTSKYISQVPRMWNLLLTYSSPRGWEQTCSLPPPRLHQHCTGANSKSC